MKALENSGNPASTALEAEPRDPEELKSWRSSTRKALVARRMAMPVDDHERLSMAISRNLASLLEHDVHGIIGFCWPYKREFDPRPTILQMQQLGARAALPVVVAPDAPLAFRAWTPDSPMEEGAYGIAIPREGACIQPDVIVLPANGYDDQGYRLGYGGGYFDRTLALMPARPRVIGVTFAFGHLRTIHPQEHDEPMDFVVTECGIYRRRPDGNLVAA